MLGLTSLFGLIIFFVSFGIMAWHVGYGLMLMLYGISIVAITIVAVVRMIKNQNFGFLTLGFFVLLFFFSLVAMIIHSNDGASWFFLYLFIYGLMGMPCALFASVPMNDFAGGFKKLLKEATVLDYILLGVYTLFAIIVSVM